MLLASPDMCQTEKVLSIVMAGLTSVWWRGHGARDAVPGYCPPISTLQAGYEDERRPRLQVAVAVAAERETGGVWTDRACTIIVSGSKSCR
jgi:hypothetical protein